MSNYVTHCSRCGEHTYVTPLHGDKGGPLFCPLCAGAWHASTTDPPGTTQRPVVR